MALYGRYTRTRVGIAQCCKPQKVRRVGRATLQPDHRVQAMTSGGGVKGPWNKWRGPGCGEWAVHAAKALDADAVTMLCGRGLGFNPTTATRRARGLGRSPERCALLWCVAAFHRATVVTSQSGHEPTSVYRKPTAATNLKRPIGRTATPPKKTAPHPRCRKNLHFSRVSFNRLCATPVKWYGGSLYALSRPTRPSVNSRKEGPINYNEIS